MNHANNSIPTVDTAQSPIYFPLEDIVSSCGKYSNASTVFELEQGLLVLEANSDTAIKFLTGFGLNSGNAMMYGTKKGTNFLVRVEPGVYARSDIRDANENPDHIGVRASGCAIQFFYTGKLAAELSRWNSVEDVVPVTQYLVDAVFSHNGEAAPRRTARSSRLAALRSALRSAAAFCMSHHDWMRWLKAIFHETQGSDEGLAIANAWSLENNDYPGYDAMDHLWRTFGALAYPEDFVTLETVVRELEGRRGVGAANAA